MIELAAGKLRLVLDPETGGAIASLTYEGVELLRPVADPRLAAQQRPRRSPAYPLIPYANRIAWGRFGFAGRSYAIDRNFGDHPHTIHGNAWMHPWHAVHTTGTSARLVFDNDPAARAHEWPFAYHAEQLYQVRGQEIIVTLSVQNTDRRRWPAGLGLHPYIARAPGTILRFEADTIWSNDPNSLPATRTAVHGDEEFDRSREASSTLDNCYAGWGGEVEIVTPNQPFTLTIEATPPFDHLQVYTPEGENFMGLEPVSNMPDAINRLDTIPDHGLQTLQPGATLQGQVKLRLHHPEA